MTARCRHQRANRHGSTVLLALGAVAAFAILIGGGYFYFRSSSNVAKEVVLTAVVTRGPFENVVLEQGEVESSKNVEVMCEVKSRNTTGTAILWVIPEGTRVEKGEKLVEFDSSALELEIKEQRILVNNGLAAKIAAQSALDQAVVAKSEYLEGTYTQEEKLIQSEILIAEEKLSRAQETAKYSERLAALGFQTTLQLKADQFAVEQARVELELAKSKLRTLQEITKKKMLIQLDAAIETARAQLEAATSSYAEEQKKLNDLSEQIAKCVVYAPEEGVVVHANKTNNRGNSEFVVEPGSMVRERQVIIRLPDPAKMQIKANINEARVTLVKEDLPVAIRIGAFQDLPMQGVVTKVNKYAEPTSWFSAQIKEYATFIQILDPPPGVRSGMTAEVRIFAEQLSNQLQIPVQALYEYRGHVFCLVKKGTNYSTRELAVGPSNDKFVIVNDGVEEGEEVVLNPRAYKDKLVLPDLPEVKETPSVSVGDLALAAESTNTTDTVKPEATQDDVTVANLTTEIIRRWDANADGTLNSDEIAGLPVSDRDRARALDQNADGLVDRNEFLQLRPVGAEVSNNQPTAGGGGE